MAFDDSKIQRASAHVNDDSPVTWEYRTTDAEATIEGAGYFNAYANKLVVGDTIRCHVATGGVGNQAEYHVTANTSTGRGSLLDSSGAAAVVTIDKKRVQTATAADATPSVKNLKILKTANTGATTITALDDGHVGQEVLVEIGDANTTIDFTGTTLKGNVGADWSPASGDAMRCIFDGTNWYCTIVDATA